MQHHLLLSTTTDSLLPSRTGTTTINAVLEQEHWNHCPVVMTIAELAQILKSLQELQLRQIGRLEELVALQDDPATNSRTSYSDEAVDTALHDPAPTPIQYWQAGRRPLDAVVETDYETDATTPGSTAFLSPTETTTTYTKESRKTTPETPNMKDLRLSASTLSILERESSLQSPPSPPTISEAIRSTQHLSRHAVDNHDADDEASLTTSNSNSENSSDEEDQTIATVPTVVAEGRRPRLSRQSMATTYKPLGNNDDDFENDGETCDDSAMYCPTVVANDRIHIQQQQQPDKNCKTLDEFMRHRQTRSMTSPLAASSSSNNPQPRFSHIDVDLGLLSPTPTNLTMDTVAFLNETVGQLDTVFEGGGGGDHESVASDETPVLDRYRIDLDDESPNGFRVVPNERRGGKSHRTTPVQSSSAKKTISSPLMPTTPSPNVSTPSARSSRRSKRVFRKTPYPKKKIPSTPTIDENTPFDGNISPSSAVPTAPASPLSSPVYPQQSKAVPRLERTRLSYPVSQQEERSSSLFYAQAAQATVKRASFSGIAIPPLGSSGLLLGTTRIGGGGSLGVSHNNLIRPVTAAEYDNGPRVVKLQVSLEQIDQSVTALNAALRNRTCVTGETSSPLVLAQSQAYRILQPLGYNDVQCRSVLMTLCHFRRLMMKRHSLSGVKTDGIVFEIQTSV